MAISLKTIMYLIKEKGPHGYQAKHHHVSIKEKGPPGYQAKIHHESIKRKRNTWISG